MKKVNALLISIFIKAICILVLFTPVPTWAATYYFDAVYGNDVTGVPDNVNRPFQSINQINSLFQAGTIVPGDYIKFRMGTAPGQQTFQGYLYLYNTCGSQGSPVTITSYAVNSGTETYKPVINSALILSDHSMSGTVGPSGAGFAWGGGPTVYTASLGNNSGYSVWEDGLMLRGASANTCLDGNVYFDSSAQILYYKPSSGTPANHLIEHGYAGRSIYAPGNNSYITVDGLQFNREGSYVSNGNGYNVVGWTFQDCDFTQEGVGFCNSGPESVTDITVQNCTFDYCCGHSIWFEGGDGNTFLRLNVLNNKITHNNTFPGTTQEWVVYDSGAYGDNDCISIQCMKDSNFIGNEISGHCSSDNCAGHKFLYRGWPYLYSHNRSG